MKTTLIKDSVVYRLEEEVNSYSDQLAPPLVISSGVPRSEGLHLSTILDDLDTFDGNGKKYSGAGGAEYMALGFAWERLLERVIGDVFPHGDIVKHPGEVSLVGISMSPDAIDVACGVLEEWKCSFKSAAKRPDRGDFPRWMRQIKAYLKGLELNTCRLRILHLAGSYSTPLEDGKIVRGPIMRTWLLEFTQEEIDANWHTIIERARQRGWIE